MIEIQQFYFTYIQSLSYIFCYCLTLFSFHLTLLTGFKVYHIILYRSMLSYLYANFVNNAKKIIMWTKSEEKIFSIISRFLLGKLLWGKIYLEEIDCWKKIVNPDSFSIKLALLLLWSFINDYPIMTKFYLIILKCK